MPNIRIMNWNIESLSWHKASISGMIDAIARTVIAQRIDLLVILEVKKFNVQRAMNALSSGLNGFATALGFPDDYRTWCISYETGVEYYGFIIRDLNVIRPIAVATGPTGAQNDRIRNTYRNTFATWPATFAAQPNGYANFPAAGPLRGPNLPIVDTYSGPAQTRRHAPRFRGANFALGGLSLGRGYRAPCMALFEVLATHGAANTLLPVVTCHYMAGRAPACTQMGQVKDLHISQLYATGNYIDLNNQAVLVQELIVTGDFNVDFQSVDPTGSRSQQANWQAYRHLTGALPGQGSLTAVAPPGPAQPVPAVPFVPPYPPIIATDQIPNLDLRVAATGADQKAHLKNLKSIPVPTGSASMRDHAYDNFIYGGTQLAHGGTRVPCPIGAPPPPFGPPAHDSCLIVDLASNIRLQGNPAITNNGGLFSLKGPARYYSNIGKRGARARPGLQAVTPAAVLLNTLDRWVGAKLVSDHLPTVIELALQ